MLRPNLAVASRIPATTVATVVAGIREATARLGRSIDDDHYGATFSYRFGSVDDPIAQQSIKGYSARLDGDPMDLLAIGDDAVISKRIEEFLALGILRSFC